MHGIKNLSLNDKNGLSLINVDGGKNDKYLKEFKLQQVNIPKRTDAQIFVLCYKPVDYYIPDNSLYTPLLCGASVTKHKNLYPLKDNAGDSISERNQFYAEATGTYWIWENMCNKYKYIGQTQYRRQLLLKENANFDEIFSKYDAIISKAISFGGISVYRQYSNHHNSKDLDIAKSIISKKFPSYLPNFDKYIVNGNKLYANAGIILRSEDFARYCNFLFTIIDAHIVGSNASCRFGMVPSYLLFHS